MTLARHFPLILGLLVANLLVGCASVPPAPPTPPPPPSSLSVGETNIVALAVPAASSGPQQNLFQFLGLDKIFGGLGSGLNRICSRIKSGLGLTGKFPGLQPKPPVVPITDPANSSEEASPAVQAAAKVKAEQDQADQKIQAIRYLASVGCSECYPEVEESLLAALDDCTESVRYEAIKALRGESKATCSQCCSGGGCCSKKVQDKLSKLVNDYKKDGARVEPSQRIRRQARLILENCVPANITDEPGVPSEGPSSSADNKNESPTLAVEPSPRPNTSSQSSIAFPDPELCVSYVDNQPIKAWELDDSIHQQLRELNKNDFEELSPSVRTAIVEQALKQAIARRLKKNSFAAKHLEIATWSDEYETELDRWFRHEIIPTPEFSEKELFDYYQAHIDDFTDPARIKWEKASITLENSEQFASAFNTLEYLRLSAEGISAKKPKAYGKINVDVKSYELESVNILPEKIRGILLGLPLGKTSGVIRIDNELMIARVLNRQDEALIPIELARTKVLSRLEARYQKQAEHDWFQNAITSHSIWTILDTTPPESIVDAPNQLAKIGYTSNKVNNPKNATRSSEPTSNRIPVFERESFTNQIDKAAFVTDSLIQSVSRNESALDCSTVKEKKLKEQAPLLTQSLPAEKQLESRTQEKIKPTQNYATSLAYIAEIKSKLDAERRSKEESSKKPNSNILHIKRNSSSPKTLPTSGQLPEYKSIIQTADLQQTPPPKVSNGQEKLPAEITISSNSDVKFNKNKELFTPLPKVDFSP